MIKMDFNELEKKLLQSKAPKDSVSFAKQYIAPVNYEAFASLFSSEEQAQEAVKAIKQYSKIEGNTYAQAVFKLIQNAGENQPQFTLDDGSKLYRPLSFKENLVARIEQPDLFDNYWDSCTGVAHKKNSSLVKIQPVCKELITIDKRFKGNFLGVDYKTFDGEELDVSKTSKMDKWLVAMGGVNAENKEIYNNYQKVLFERRPNLCKEEAMNFYTVDNPLNDQLRALYVHNFSSNTYCNFDLYDDAWFLRVDQRRRRNIWVGTRRMSRVR